MQQIAQTRQPQTREILLEAAGEVFGECGYKAATLRAICERAGVNVALVKYHFGDKERLYDEVVRFSAYCVGAQDFPSEVVSEGVLAQDERLRRYIVSFMERLLDRGRPAWHRKLIARELMDPSGLLDRLARDTFAPHFRLLLSIVEQCLGPASTPDLVKLCSASILGQILFYQHGRSYIVRVAPDVQYSARQIEEWSEHVFQFSQAALAGLALRAPTARNQAGAQFKLK